MAKSNYTRVMIVKKLQQHNHIIRTPRVALGTSAQSFIFKSVLAIAVGIVRLKPDEDKTNSSIHLSVFKQLSPTRIFAKSGKYCFHRSKEQLPLT